MNVTSPLNGGELVVVETDVDSFIGVATFEGDDIVIRNGFVGRPVLVPLSDVRRITPADDHPDVVTASGISPVDA